MHKRLGVPGLKLGLLFCLVIFSLSGKVFGQDGHGGGGAAPLLISPEDSYRMHYRSLNSVSIKITDRFSIGGFGALYYGKPWPFIGHSHFWFWGWDFVPGISMNLGTIKDFSLGMSTEVYFVHREQFEEGKYAYGPDDFVEARPRASAWVNYPISPWLNLQHISRWERRILQRPDIFRHTQSRYRPSFKLSTKEFPSLFNFSVFAYYEEMVVLGANTGIELESEAGFSFRPISSLALRYGLLWNVKPEIEKKGYLMSTLYLAYNFDASKYFNLK